MDGRSLSPDEISKLADLESREVLLAKLAGAMKASLSGAVSLFAAPLSQTARLIEALRHKAEQDPSVLRGGAGTPAPQPVDDAAPVAQEQDAAPAAAEHEDEAPAVQDEAVATEEAQSQESPSEDTPSEDVTAEDSRDRGARLPGRDDRGDHRGLSAHG